MSRSLRNLIATKPLFFANVLLTAVSTAFQSLKIPLLAFLYLLDEIGQMVGLDIDIRNPSIEAIGLGFDIHNPSAKNQMIIGLKFDIRNPLAGDKMIAGPDFDIHNPSADQMMVGLGLDIHNPSVE
ncbi:259_t:CDS:2, partial [Rhizophagus irregularis]